MLPARYDLVILQGADWFLPFRLKDAAGKLVDLAGYSARMKVRATPQTPSTELELTTANSRLEVGYSPGKWLASTPYALAQQVVPPTLNGHVYEVSVAGTGGASQPAWPTVLGAAVASGTATFKNVGPDTSATNLRISVPAAATAALEEWGPGVYDLELVDPFGKVTRLIEGRAVLSPEVTY